MVCMDYQYTHDNCGDANTIGSERGMKTNNNQIIHDMHVEDLTQVENYDEIGFEVGSIREEHETFRSMHFDKRYYGMEFGKRYYYIKSAGIHFPISKDSAETINAKMVRLQEYPFFSLNLKKCVEEAEKNREESEQECLEKESGWRFVKVSLMDEKEITIPKDAIGVKRIKNCITWFEPYKKEKIRSVKWGEGDPELREYM